MTEVSENNISLLEYAKEGNPILIRSPYCIHACTRRWQPRGDLENDDRFACYQYLWMETDYLVYKVCWKDNYMPPSKMLYILKEGGDITDGHCRQTDDLLRVTAEWTSKLHEEIFVFDDGYWGKSKEMFKSIQEASWEAVSLDDAEITATSLPNRSF
jgi:transitional endoplasmic reticulum ATPase